MSRHTRPIAAAALAALLLLHGDWANASTSATPAPEAGAPFFSVGEALVGRGYIEEEWIIRGTARAHTSGYGTKQVGAFVGDPASYVTRILVRRPADVARYNGVAVVEWENVSNGFPSRNLWLSASEHLVRAGYAWIGVTAQGFGGAERLRSWNPARYEELSILNGGRMAVEPYALGVFDDVGRLLRGDGPLASLGGARRLIATGQSQGGIWVTTYLNAGLAAEGPFDGFLLSAAIAAPITGCPAKPVLRIVPEGDVRGDEAALFMADDATFRQWEIAGASHVDRDLRAAREPLELRDLGRSTQAAIAPTCNEPEIGVRPGESAQPPDR